MQIHGNRREVTGQFTGLDPWLQFQRELNRSRRYGHALALLWFGPRAGDEVAIEALAATVDRLSRDIDCCWIADGRLLVLLPESSRTGAERLAARIAAAEPALAARVETRIASFPDDGLTSGALLGAVARAADTEVATPAAEEATPSAVHEPTYRPASSAAKRLLRFPRAQRAPAPAPAALRSELRS